MVTIEHLLSPYDQTVIPYTTYRQLLAKLLWVYRGQYNSFPPSIDYALAYYCFRIGGEECSCSVIRHAAKYTLFK